MKKILFYVALPVLLLMLVTRKYSHIEMVDIGSTLLADTYYLDLGVFSFVWLWMGFLFFNDTGR